MIRIEFIFLHGMLSTGQLRGHDAKVGFFSHAHEGGGFPSFEALERDSAKRLKLDQAAPSSVRYSFGSADDVHLRKDGFHV